MNRLDQAIKQVQSEEPAPAAVAQSAEQVRRNLFGAGAAGATELNNCDDFRSLFTAYLQKSLSDARRMLVEDHLHTCVSCRKQMERLRSGAPATVRPMPVVTAGGRSPQFRWAVAAAVVIGAGLSVFAASRWMPAAFHTGAQASISTVDGMLYRVSNDASLPVGAGTEISSDQPVRTPAGSRATLALWDGSRIEMNERSQLSVSTGWKGTTIRLDRGHIIVQAAKQKQGHLIVASGDARVAVKGTVFSVNKGTLGSRVSVVEGSVEVAQYGRTESLKPGDQTTTSPMVGKIPVEAEVAWSKEAARYVALLGEFQALQKGWEGIPSQGLRHQSRLLVLLPEDTRILAALPNMGLTLVEAKRVFDERLKSSETLRQWWMDPSPARTKMRTEMDSIMAVLKDLSAMVGDEILIGIGSDNGKERVVVLAEAKSPELQTKLAALFQAQSSDGGKQPFAYTVKDNVLMLSDSAQGLAAVQASQARGGSPSTPFRQRVERAYRDGAGWVFAADLQKLGAANELGGKDAGALGLDTLEYLVAERREIGGRVENSASVSFAGERKGIPAWLGAPSAISTLNFVSPDAGAAVSFVVKEPRTIVEELFQVARKQSSDFDKNLAEIEQELGIRILDDVAAALGVEVTIAFDGPLLPVPSWKIAAEVHAPQRLQASIEKMVEAFNRHAGQTPKLVLTKEQVAGRQFVKIAGGRLPTEVHFTFVDSYLLAAPDRALLTQAIQNRQTGFTLAQSEKFRSQLPFAGDPNFSGVVYHNIAGTVSALADQFGSLINLTPAQQESVNALKESKPGVITLRADQDRIRIGTTGAFGGLNLGMLTNPGGMFSVLSRQQ